MASVPALPRHASSITPDEVRTLLGPVEHPLILEIGANDGGDGRALAAALPHARVHCFECDPRALERFRAAPTPPNVTLHTYALGAYDGRSTFHASGGTHPTSGKGEWDLSGSLRRPTGHKERYRWCTFERSFEVEVRRLDTWLAGMLLPTVDFIWLDVQGSEADVFEGAPRALRRTRYLYSEFNAWKKPLYEGDLTLEATLAALGPAWTPLGIYEGYNVLLRNEELVRPSASRG